MEKTYGKLTVLGFSHRVKSADYFKCQCSCGSPEKIIMGSNLTSGNTTSCGHCREFELIGKKFGKLTVLKFDHRKKESYFLCSCSCGSPAKIIMGSNLTSGGTVSCNHCQEYELIGKTFGNLTVLKFTGRDKGNNARFLCSCRDHETIVKGVNLLTGNTTQCKSCANKVRLRIGTNEKKILNQKSKELGIVIERQVTFLPYTVDGYCWETNTIFEVYEKHHDTTVEYDLKRQQELQQRLKCEFVIIPDRSH